MGAGVTGGGILWFLWLTGQRVSFSIYRTWREALRRSYRLGCEPTGRSLRRRLAGVGAGTRCGGAYGRSLLSELCVCDAAERAVASDLSFAVSGTVAVREQPGDPGRAGGDASDGALRELAAAGGPAGAGEGATAARS